MTRAELFGTLVPDGRMLAGRPADQPDDAEGSAEQPEYAERDAGEPLHRDLLTLFGALQVLLSTAGIPNRRMDITGYGTRRPGHLLGSVRHRSRWSAR